MNIVANGKPRDVTDGDTIGSLLRSLAWKAEWVVVEYNGEPLERACYETVLLRDGDRLEIVRAVAGGATNR